MKKNTFLVKTLWCACIWSVFLCSCEEPKREGTVTNEGVAIAYTDCGSGDTTLLFVHGWCIDQTYWTAQVDYFCPKYRVVTIDLPGHGKSGKNRKEWSIAAFGDDVASVMQQLQLKNVIMIGHSMSGNVNLEAALQYPNPVVGFIGIDNFKELGIEYAPEELLGVENFLTSMETDFVEVTAHYVQESLLTPQAKTEIVEKVTDDMTSVPPSIAIPIIRSLISYNTIEREQMPKLGYKLVLVNSDNFPTNLDLLHQYAPRFEVITIHGTGHYPMIENPTEFNARLQEAIWKVD
jgi:pimeloyl-ACP methyl ester carboxylesterase